MLKWTHERQWENWRWEVETIYRTLKGKKILKKQLPNGSWITIKN